MIKHKLVLMQTSPYERIRGKKEKKLESDLQIIGVMVLFAYFIVMFNVLKEKFESIYKTTRDIIMNQATC